MISDVIYFMEKNRSGAWVVHGELGIRMYYDHTKREAREKYLEEYNRTIFVNMEG